MHLAYHTHICSFALNLARSCYQIVDRSFIWMLLSRILAWNSRCLSLLLFCLRWFRLFLLVRGSGWWAPLDGSPTWISASQYLPLSSQFSGRPCLSGRSSTGFDYYSNVCWFLLRSWKSFVTPYWTMKTIWQALVTGFGSLSFITWRKFGWSGHLCPWLPS